MTLLFSGILFVGATIYNVTNTNSFNETDVFGLNESTPNARTETNKTEEINQSIKVTIEESNLKDTLKEHKNKLNKKTEAYLEAVKDKKEKEDYIIKFKQSIDENKLKKVRLEKRYNKFKTVKIKAKAEDISELLSDSDIKYLELDQEIETLGDNIPYGIDKTNAPNVWNKTKGNGVKVAVLDTGVSSHTDLSIAGGISVISDDYVDNNGHGTVIIGVISALLNDEGLVGVAPSADIYAVKVMESSIGELSNAIEGLEWAIDNNMEIISMSFGMGTYSQIFKEVLEEAYNDGILLIVASGNNGENNILYPAAYSSAIAVGATDENDEKASFSSYGNELELVAPGVNVNSTDLGNDYSVSSGTSMSAPHVSGVAALVWAYNNSLTNEQIRAKLRNDALDLGSSGKDDFYGYGLVQADLENWDFSVQNESYFYEVFNIINYGTPKEDFLFWLNGNGTIDDVEFKEGYYLVKKYMDNRIIEEKYYVNENGILSLLYAPHVDFDYDDFTYEGDASDGIVWVNGEMQFNFEDTAYDEDVACFDKDYGGSFDFWKCWSVSSTALSDCRSADSDLDNFCNANPSDCSSSGINDWHDLPIGGSRDKKVLRAKVFYYCDSSPTMQHSNWPHYIIDGKKTACSGSSAYDIEGRYDTGEFEWIETNGCPANYECDESIAGSYTATTYNYDFDSGQYYPCVPIVTEPKCNGTINVYSQDSKGEPMNGSCVKLNGVLNGTTDVDRGWLGIDLYNEDCGEDQNVSVYCPDNETKLCSTKKTSLDFNNDEDSLFFDCNLCKTDRNLKIEINDVSLKLSSGNTYTITTTVHTQNVNENNLNVTVKGQNKDTGLISIENDDIISVSGSKDFNATVTMDLTNIDYVHVYADADNKVTDEPADDNYVLVPVVKHKLKANLSVNTGHSLVDSVIKNYLKFYIDDTSQSQADVIVSIGRYTSEVTSYNTNTLNQVGRDWGWKKGKIYVDNKPLEMPYSGLVGSYKPVGAKARIFIYGNRIEGTIAALKEFISARGVFFNKDLYSGMENFQNKKLVILDKYDVSAIGVFDLMHNDENGPYFDDLDSQDFADVVTDILNDDNFEISIKTVKTINDNTTLRLKHANSDYSNNFKDAIVGNQQPVVLAHGIHSNLFTWNDFATDLATDAENARDAWLIEMYGGPTTECSTCPVYDFNDLRSYYWPSLLAGVQHYSGQNNLSYVGYDLGCTVALESLENYSSGANNIGYYFDTTTGDYNYAEPMDLSSDPIDTFVGVACIGNFSPIIVNSTFNILPFFSSYIENHPTVYQDDGFLSVYNLYSGHLPGGFYFMPNFINTFWVPFPPPFNTWYYQNLISFLVGTLDVRIPSLGSSPISMKIYQDIISWINGSVNPEVGKNVGLNNMAIIQSIYTEDDTSKGFIEYRRNTNYFVSNSDQLQICKNINSNNKYYIGFKNLPHFGSVFDPGMSERNKVQRTIKEFLNDQSVKQNKNFEIISTNSNCE